MLFLFFYQTALSQSYNPGRTHTIETTLHVSGITDISEVANQPAENRTRVVTHYDRLGRPIQSKTLCGSPSRKDVVQHIEYDNFGRSTKTYLPYVSTSIDVGEYRSNPKTEQSSFYATTPKITNSGILYAITEIEKSPLARVMSQAAPGSYWQTGGHIMRYEYKLNSASDNVYKWEITTQGELKLSSSTYYSANTLKVNVVKDENWQSSFGNKGTVRSFTDHLGNTILKRTYNDAGQALDTYYVYDDFGNLRYILPPEAVSRLGSSLNGIGDDNIFTTSQSFPSAKPRNQVYYYMPGVTVTLPASMTFTTGFQLKPYPVSAEFIEDYIYVNYYDDKNRLSKKKVPGADWLYYVYDKSGRLIMSQDGNQRKNDEWTFTKYDVHNRPVLTGVTTDSRSLSALQAYVENNVGSTFAWYESEGSVVHGYTNDAFPNVRDPNKYLVVTYYDGYSFMSSWGSVYEFDNSNGINNGPKVSIVRGLETGSKIKVLGTNAWLKAVKYYDKDHNVIQTVADHYNDEIERTYALYDFSGQVLKTRFEHMINSYNTISVQERFEYDHTGRLLKHWHSVADHPEVLLANYEYNELGQVVDKKIHSTDNGSTFMQSIDYRYNIRGWLTSINNAARNVDSKNDDTNDVFGMELYYNSSPSGLTFPTQNNGSISGATWSNNKMNNDQRSYAYNYNKINQLNSAIYKEKAATAWNAKTGHYNVENITYDKNGNIKTLERKHSISNTATTIDNLAYEYDGNQLKAVDDASNHENGFKDGANIDIEYEYDANGNLVKDHNKLIQSITYNRLNLPERITFESGDYIGYVYSAAGEKLVQKVYVNGQLQEYTDYSSGLIFEDDILKMIAMPEGRIKVDVVGNDYNYDYQYIITDHLGNSRVMVAPQVRVYAATMESSKASEEEAQFLNVDKTRVTDAVYNHTPSGNESAMLNATKTNVDGTKKIIGPAKAIKVYGGDEVDMEVWAKYAGVATSATNTSTLIFDMIASAYGLSPSGSTEAIYSAMNTFFGGATLINQTSIERPAAYLQYIYYDKDFNDTPIYGYAQVPTASATSFQKLSLNFTAPGEGYLFIYVMNQSKLDRNVYFDDFKITHTSAATVLQSDDYYPFGLVMENNNFTEEGVTANRFLYQGKEWQTELALNLYDFHARMYDPALGRWHNVDPKSQFGSPYLAMGNVPTMAIDPDGQWVAELIAGIIATGVAIYEGVQYKEAGMNFWEGFAMSSAQSTANYIAGSFVGTIFSSGSGILNEIGRAAAHGVAQGGISSAFGGDFWSSAAAGAFSSAAGSALHGAPGGVMVAGSAVAGGISAEIAGGDFWSGAATGAIVAVANHLHHLRKLGVSVKLLSENLVEIDGELIDLSKPDAGQRLVEKLREMKMQKVRLYLEEYVDMNTQLEGTLGKIADVFGGWATTTSGSREIFGKRVHIKIIYKKDYQNNYIKRYSDHRVRNISYQETINPANDLFYSTVSILGGSRNAFITFQMSGINNRLHMQKIYNYITGN